MIMKPNLQFPNLDKVQALITPNLDQFLILKQFLKPRNQTKSVIGIISPFQMKNGSYNSNLILPLNRKPRILSIYKMISKLAIYQVSTQSISFDCISKLNPKLFNNFKSGYIHFDSKEDYTSAKVRMIIEDKQLETFNLDFDSVEIQFKTNKLKIFPLIMKNGFILSAIDETKMILYFTLIDPKGLTVGECIRSQITTITNYILPIWNDFFSISINNDFPGILIELNNNYFQSTPIINYSAPILIKFFRTFENINSINISIIGIGKTIITN